MVADGKALACGLPGRRESSNVEFAYILNVTFCLHAYISHTQPWNRGSDTKPRQILLLGTSTLHQWLLQRNCVSRTNYGKRAEGKLFCYCSAHPSQKLCRETYIAPTKTAGLPKTEASELAHHEGYERPYAIAVSAKHSTISLESLSCMARG